MKSYISLALTCSLAACTVGPDYEKPTQLADAVTADRFLHSGTASVIQDPVAAWWEQFGDERLNMLVSQAFSANRDIAVAVATLRAARASVSERYQDNLPFVDVNGQYQRQRPSAAAIAFTGPGIPAVFPDQDFFDAGIDATWEIDIFGRIRRGVQAARAELVSAQADRDDLKVSIAAEVASAYIDLRGAQSRMAVAIRNRDNQRETLELTRTLLRGGRGTQLDVDRALTQLSTTQASIPPLRAAVNVAIQRLGVLTGLGPAALQDDLAASADFPDIAGQASGPGADAAFGGPASLLRRRPDIRAAEAQLVAATARIGIETADLFPQVTLIGGVGFQSLSSDQMFETGSFTYGVGPSIQWNFLNYFRIKQRIAQSRALADAQLARYEQTILLALEETENALTRYRTQQQRFVQLSAAARAARDSARLSELRYRNGVDSFLNVLDAERVQLQTEDLLASSRITVARDYIAIYKALGGGWTVTAAP